MARPERHDVDYFPFIVKRGRTLNALQSEYGNEGIGFFTNLMRLLSITPDHHYSIKKDSDRRNFFTETGTSNDKEKAIAMIELMIDTEKLDKDLWEKHQVIACDDFLKNVVGAYERRKNNIITMDEIRAYYSGEEIIPKADTGTPQKPKAPKKEKNKGDPTQSMIDALALAELLFSLHQKEVPDYHSGKDIEKVKSDWASDIEKIIRLDKKTPDIIRQVIEWAKTPGRFWFPNIQSGSKLRKQFETLYSQMVNDSKKTSKPAQPHKIAADKTKLEKLDEVF